MTAWRPGLNAAAAAAFAAIVAWAGPPGADFAAHVFQRNLYLTHGFALWTNYWYAGRYSFVGYSLVYYPLAAVVGIKLLAVLSVAGATAAFTAVSRAHVGIGCDLGRALLRGRRRRVRPHSRFPVWPRARVCARRPRRAQPRPPLGLRSPRRAHLRRQPARVRAPARRSRRCRGVTNPARDHEARTGDHRRRRGRRDPLADVPGRWPLSVLDRRAPRCADVLRARLRSHLARRTGAYPPHLLRGLRTRVPCRIHRSVGSRRKRRAAPLRSPSTCCPDPLAPALAPPALRDGRARARPLLERDPAGIQLLPYVERPLGLGCVLAAGRRIPPPKPHAGLPGRSRRHRRPLGGRLPRAGPHPDRAWLVPSGRLPPERVALRRPRPARLSRVAA